MDEFISQINSYHQLSPLTIEILKGISSEKSFKKNEIILREGDLARYYYFVKSGLLGYYTIDEGGKIIYKLFFEENSFCASVSSIIQGIPSHFSIRALEDSEVIMYPAETFRKLISEHHDLALFQIAYLEKNWVVKKEPLEINLKSETAKQRYITLYQNEKLFDRLKQHEIASYLGITPTQLSRIRKELNL
ncbi:Crp/Fnr family transcriptional regulator [Flavobacterium quisquiliarum]|uniref:Crp/Fnr family transcriptional regulator n=1 Tax=Flavobacterium quisquiliarum TaxID=1834436 RepID=A0ABV8VZJ7_9FLAO|nr:Crp/Fnr family transcriptional regulator [Flavobacterium quisquiliarum]MBW1654570.1 cyclic nucleotide-binding domain-containing protein [Flavobacterium quisquiliarum]NWL01745.1 Crp/Fnr family transcriptional regulator [Flavobacterium collinsii]